MNNVLLFFYYQTINLTVGSYLGVQNPPGGKHFWYVVQVIFQHFGQFADRFGILYEIRSEPYPLICLAPLRFPFLWYFSSYTIILSFLSL